jgi:hypothetical protein
LIPFKYIFYLKFFKQGKGIFEQINSSLF